MQIELVALGVAIAVALIGVPIVRSLARRTGTVDSPDPTRKLHSGQIALGGGLAVLLAMYAALIAAFAMQSFLGAELLAWSSKWTALALVCLAIVTLGVVDDRFTLRGRQKLLGQIAIAVAITLASNVGREINILGLQINLGIFAFPVTVLWLLGAINAINLLDGADGMASTIGAILSAGFAAIAAIKGMPLESATCLAMTGALLGFLIYNRPPASIFLGDAGSMLIGLVLGVMALWGSQQGTTVLVIAPLAVLAIPLFDSAIAVLRRVLTGRSLYDADRGHMHHRFLERYSHRRSLVIVALLCSICTISAVLSVAWDQQWIAPVGAIVAIGWLIASGSFGYTECVLLLTRGWYFVESFFTAARRCDEQVHQRTYQIQGSRSWESLWTSLIEFADKHHLARVKMDLNIAWMHEGYHGSYQRARLPERSTQVLLRLPIRAHDRIVGRLEVIGSGDVPDLHNVLDLLVERLRDLQPEVERLMSQLNAEHQAKRAARQAELQARHAQPQLCAAESLAGGSPRAAETASAARFAEVARNDRRH